MKLRDPKAWAIVALAGWTGIAVGADTAAGKRVIDRGRYLVEIGGCNDCHTPQYPETAGKVPEADRLTGSSVGFQGPWGTTYPVNLRILMHSLSEGEWLAKSAAPMRPPMPWYSLAKMTESDRRALYRYVHSLGPRGDPAPAFVPPGDLVKTPYILFIPQNLPKQADRAR
jgi:mono/diheme cytochrome c family protein